MPEVPLTFRPIRGRFASSMFERVLKKGRHAPAKIEVSKPERRCHEWFVALLALLRQLPVEVRRHRIEPWATEDGQL